MDQCQQSRLLFIQCRLLLSWNPLGNRSRRHSHPTTVVALRIASLALCTPERCRFRTSQLAWCNVYLTRSRIEQPSMLRTQLGLRQYRRYNKAHYSCPNLQRMYESRYKTWRASARVGCVSKWQRTWWSPHFFSYQGRHLPGRCSHHLLRLRLGTCTQYRREEIRLPNLIFRIYFWRGRCKTPCYCSTWAGVSGWLHPQGLGS